MKKYLLLLFVSSFLLDVANAQTVADQKIPCIDEMVALGNDLFTESGYRTNVVVQLDNQIEYSLVKGIQMAWKAQENKYDGTSISVRMVAKPGSCEAELF